MIKFALRLIAPVLIFLTIGISTYQTAIMQEATDNTCPELVQTALRELETNCTGLGRNVACYGYNRVGATFSAEVAEDYFSQPSDRADLVTLQSISTAPLNTINNEWGVALLNAQANLPGTLPGQSVTFILLGDATVVNAVAEGEAALPVDPINVVSALETSLRTYATETSNSVATIPTGSDLAADAVSQDGLWVRVVYGQTGGWVRTDSLASIDLSTLPTVTDETLTPMQAFVFRTGIEQPTCTEAPNSVVIQGPTNTQVNLNVNGADIVVGSTVTMQSVQGAPQDIIDNLDLPDDVAEKLSDTPETEDQPQECALMQLSVVSGEALLNDGEFILPEGNAAWSVYCAEEGELLPNDLTQNPETTQEPGSETTPEPSENVAFASEWGAFRTLTQEELDELEVLEELPPEILNYTIEVPAEGDIIPAYQNTPSPTPTSIGMVLPMTATPSPTVIPTLTPTSVPGPTALPGIGSPAVVAPIEGTNNQTATVGQPFAVPFQVRILDPYGTPVSGTSVTFSAPTSGASGTFAATSTPAETVTSDADGYATASTFTTNTISGSYTITASVNATTAMKDTVYARRSSAILSAAAQGNPSATFSVTNAPAPASALSITGGSGQSAEVATAFSTPLQARITDTYGNGVPNVDVTFTAPTTGASGTFAATGSSTQTVTSDASGNATASAFTANTTSGFYNVTVTSSVGSGSISLTNTAGAPAAITATSGTTPQTTTVGTAFTVGLQARVTDANGNGVPGVSVIFSAPASGASGTFGGSTTVSTNALGYANAPAFTANATAGSYTVTASAGSLSTGFSLTNTADAPAAITSIAGSGQSTVVTTPFANTLQAQVTDSYGNPVSGVTVTFTAPSEGAGAFFDGGTSTTTDASGIATSPLVIANSVAGSYNVGAIAGALSTSFSLTNTPGSAAYLTPNSGSYQSAQVTTTFATPLEARVTDSYANPIAGASVTFTPPATGASGTFSGSTTVTTDTFGIAIAPAFTANTFAGNYVVTATSGALSTTFDLTNTASIPTSVIPTSGSSQTTTSYSNFGAPLSVFVEDAYGNAVPGATVTFAAPASGATLTFASTGATTETATTNSSGIATTSIMTANCAGGSYDVNATIGGVGPGVFTLTNNNPTPATSGITPSSATEGDAGFTLTIDGSNFACGAVVTWAGQANLAPATLTSTQITVSVPASYVAAAGSYAVGVTNPAPAGGASNAQTFTVNSATMVTSLSDSGPGSLRQVVANAPAGSTITFGVTGTISLTSEIPIAKNLSINGPGSGSLVINGTSSTRIFSLTGGSGVTIALRGMHLQGSISNIISSFVTLTVENMWISNSGDIALYIAEGAGETTIASSTFSDNTASFDSGGAFQSNNNVLVVNSTFVGNTGSQGAFSARMGTVIVVNSTFANNTGIENQTMFGSNISLTNVILYNTSCTGTIYDDSGNLLYGGTCGGMSAGGDPQLGTLAFNGGGTPTLALGGSSAALNTGNGTVCTNVIVNSVDQRGAARTTTCDIGAYEG